MYTPIESLESFNLHSLVADVHNMGIEVMDSHQELQTKKEKVIVFGGAGFLGSHVADELTAQNYDVSIFDLKVSPWLSSKQKMIQGDILDKDAVIEACKGFDYVYNFAGIADLNQARQDPEATIQLNILGNFHILEAARLASVKRFVYASTVYVNGDSGSFYRASKQACERYVELYFEKYGLDFTILRYGSLYGRRTDRSNGIHSFIHQALSQGRMTYKGTGAELREYIHVEDASKASVMILERQEFVNEHLILTGHRSMQVRSVMEMISEVLGNKIEVHFEDVGYDSHYKVTPYSYNKSHIGKKLTMNPSVDIGQGLLDCVQEIDHGLRIQNPEEPIVLSKRESNPSQEL